MSNYQRKEVLFQIKALKLEENKINKMNYRMQ